MDKNPGTTYFLKLVRSFNSPILGGCKNYYIRRYVKQRLGCALSSMPGLQNNSRQLPRNIVGVMLTLATISTTEIATCCDGNQNQQTCGNIFLTDCGALFKDGTCIFQIKDVKCLKYWYYEYRIQNRNLIAAVAVFTGF